MIMLYGKKNHGCNEKAQEFRFRDRPKSLILSIGNSMLMINMAVSQLGWLKVKFLIVVNMEFNYFISPGASEFFY
jgi:hypothetical protein